MKKAIVLLGLLSSVSLMSYAATVQNNPAQGVGAQPAAAAEQTAPADSHADKMQAGSGDEVDTTNEADPSKDKDPEASD